MSDGETGRAGRARKLALAALLLAALAWGGWQRAGHGATDAAPPLDTVLAGLEHRERLIRSAQGELAWQLVDGDDPEYRRLNPAVELTPRRPASRSRSYLWAFQGQCWREERRALSDDRERRLVAYDGELGRYYSPLQKAGWEVSTKNIRRSMVASEFGRWLDMAVPPADSPLSSQLRQLGAQVVGSEPVGEVPCCKLEAASPEGRVQRWWFAPSLDYLLMRHDSLVPQRGLAPGKQTVVKASLHSVVTEQVERYDGVPMPKARRLTNYLLLEDGRSVRGGAMQVTVRTLVLNRVLPPETFTITFPPGTKVVPADGAAYVVPG